ncbi:transposase [Nocardia farcinica]|uniref:transposase n=1 Tax=Nocardia farcinica TaxID=37329 RepID=UPI0024582018|nr:transposase [Nocardia farcinica]
MGVHHEALRNWIRQGDTGQPPEQEASDLTEENKRLREQVAELKPVNDTLRSASAYFASELGQTRR